MHDAAFAASARQAPVRILRLPMLPYSIGHEIILLSEHNPLLFDGANPEQRNAGLMRASLVCYRTWKQNKQAESNIRFWQWCNRRVNWESEIARFTAYRASGIEGPPSPTEENYEIAAGKTHADASSESGRQFGGSVFSKMLAYFCPLHSALGYDTPYDIPLGFGLHVYYSHLEMAGNCLIENEREAQVALEMEQHYSAISKEKEALCQP